MKQFTSQRGSEQMFGLILVDTMGNEPVDFIEKMKPYVHFVPVCAELKLFRVPRDPIV